MGNWLTTLLERKAGMVPGHLGDNESLEDYAERNRVTDVPPPPSSAKDAAPVAAGWHPDPWAKHAQRFFDGVEWTSNVADDAGNRSEDPVPTGEQPAA